VLDNGAHGDSRWEHDPATRTLSEHFARITGCPSHRIPLDGDSALTATTRASARPPVVLFLLLFLALLGLFSACSHSGSRGRAALEGVAFRDHNPEREIEAVQDDIEEALVWRVKAAEFYRYLSHTRDRGNLSADNLDRL
jgi:hypothetical protein